MCTAHIEGGRVGLRVLLHALRHYAMWAKIVLADINLAISIPTTKSPNLNPRQIFQLYSILPIVVTVLDKEPQPNIVLNWHVH